MTIGQARQAIADAKARAELYRMWHTGQRMGATHPHILDTMGPRTESADVEKLRTTLIEGTRRRVTIASILKERNTLLPPFEAAVLTAAEEAGALEESLATLAAHAASEHKMLLKVWSKLTYPLIVSLLSLFIVPLPLLVQGDVAAYVFSVGASVVAWYMFGGAVIVALAARYAHQNNFVLVRFARALAIGVEAGLPLDRVANLAAQSSAHPQIIAHVGKFPPRQLAIQPLSTTFAGCAAIPIEMHAAMSVAETTGDFSGSLRKLADLYES